MIKKYRRRKFTTYKFFVEGQVGKVFFRPQKEWKDGFWLWHIGFAVGKSTRQVNDWYYMKQNKTSPGSIVQRNFNISVKNFVTPFNPTLPVICL